MNLRSLIADFHPELKKKYASEQYDLSQEIIKKKIDLKQTQKEMAATLDISLEYYLELEGGSTDIDVNEYKKVLVKLNE